MRRSIKGYSILAILSFLFGLFSFLLFIPLNVFEILPWSESIFFIVNIIGHFLAIIFGGLFFVFREKEELKGKKMAFLGINFAFLEFFYWYFLVGILRGVW